MSREKVPLLEILIKPDENNDISSLEVTKESSAAKTQHFLEFSLPTDELHFVSRSAEEISALETLALVCRARQDQRAKDRVGEIFNFPSKDGFDRIKMLLQEVEQDPLLCPAWPRCALQCDWCETSNRVRSCIFSGRRSEGMQPATTRVVCNEGIKEAAGGTANDASAV